MKKIILFLIFLTITIYCLSEVIGDRLIKQILESNISNSLDSDNYSRDEFDLISMYFGEAEQLPFDKDGRIILPKKLINHAQIDKNVMFVGLGPTFQMWNPESYEVKKIQMVQKAKNKKINPRLKPIPKGI